LRNFRRALARNDGSAQASRSWNSPFDRWGDYVDGLSSESALCTGEEAAARTVRKIAQ